MNKNTKENRYDRLMSELMPNEKKAALLKSNIYFVGKYLSKVEEKIADENERKIIYRELGSIAFSCIELLLKTVLLDLNKKCISRKCKNKCAFRCDIKKIEQMSLMTVFNRLYDSQILWLREDGIDEMLWLREQRNGVHLSKDLGLDIENRVYDKQYVQRTINCFFNILRSFDDGISYYYWILYCSDQADGEKAKKMKALREHRQMLLCKYRLFFLLQKLFANKELTDNEKWYIERIEIPNYIDLDEIIKSINDTVDNYVDRCKREKNILVDRKELLERFTQYLKKESIKKRIMTYNENKKTEIKQ